ncbi:MAG: phosphoglucosamine mutase [Sedimentisphaeraceae bacterium JB056]
MSERKLFGTDGIRCKANCYPLDPQTVVKIGQAAAVTVGKDKKRPVFVVGRDSRISGSIIESALVAGLCSMGADVKLLGVVPTPAVAVIAKAEGADAGVVITASHNPAEDNGIKFFSGKGVKLPDEKELEIEQLIFADNFDSGSLAPAELGRVQDWSFKGYEYVDFIINAIEGVDLSGLNIVLDCANGAACNIAPVVFEKLGANVTVIHASPDGVNINENCGAMHPESLADEVARLKADIGLAFDGDADRLIVVDENGKIVDGDTIMYIIALAHKKAGKLDNDTLVVTDYSNLALDAKLKEDGINTVRVENGDRYVIQEMLKSGYVVGGEKSGHIILGRYNTTGDGVLSAVYLANAVRQSGRKISQLSEELVFFPQVLEAVEVGQKTPFDEIPGYCDLKAEIEGELGDQGRLFVRYSGTQNVCRIMLEGKDQKQITDFKDRVVEVFEANV